MHTSASAAISTSRDVPIRGGRDRGEEREKCQVKNDRHSFGCLKKQKNQGGKKQGETYSSCSSAALNLL